jgi:hypothetical protein
LIEFKIAEHKLRPGVKIVEIFVDDKFVASIYPTEENKGIQIVSAHFSKIIKVDQPEEHPKIPYLAITFRPRRYTLDEKGNIIYLE